MLQQQYHHPVPEKPIVVPNVAQVVEEHLADVVQGLVLQVLLRILEILLDIFLN